MICSQYSFVTLLFCGIISVSKTEEDVRDLKNKVFRQPYNITSNDLIDFLEDDYVREIIFIIG